MGNKQGKKSASKMAFSGGYGPKPPPPSGIGVNEAVPDRYYQRTRRCSVSSEALDPNKAKLSTHPKTPAEKQAVLNLLRNSDNFLFRNLKDVRMHMIADAMCKKTFEQGDMIITQGSVGDYFYIIHEGEVEVFVLREHEKAEGKVGLGTRVISYGEGKSFGELALMAASCRASQRTTVWALGREEFRALVVGQESMQKSRWEAFIDGVEIFSTMNQYERRAVSDSIDELDFQAGDEIICQDEAGDEMYILQDGIVEAWMIQQDGPKLLMKEYQTPGEYFGELSLLSDCPRAATVVAKTDCVVLRITRECFERLCGPIADILRRNKDEYIKYQEALMQAQNKGRVLSELAARS